MKSKVGRVLPSAGVLSVTVNVWGVSVWLKVKVKKPAVSSKTKMRIAK